MTFRSRRRGNGRVRRCGVALSTTLGACTSISSTVSKAPVLQIATALYPLAEAAIEIGQSKVEVVDIVPDGSDPTTFVPSEADRALMGNAGLVIEVGGGFQPPFEQAAAASKHLLTLGAIGPGGYPWLDPATMDSYISRIESAMAAADPRAPSLFKAGAQAFTAEVDSTGIDYETTLSVCPTPPCSPWTGRSRPWPRDLRPPRHPARGDHTVGIGDTEAGLPGAIIRSEQRVRSDLDR